MAIDPKSIRRAMMVAKDIAASVSNVPLMKTKGGSIKTVESPDRQRNLAEFMRGAHPALLNKDGTPKILYHGTSEDFSTFKPSNYLGNVHGVGGVYLTSDPDRASEYSSHHGNTGRNVMPVHVNMKNAYVLKKGEYGADAEKLKAQGYDGIIDGDTFVPFSPHQIKSAVGNRGTFDPSNPDITKADGGEVDGHPDQGYAPKPAGVLKVDNPGGDWLKENREYSENKGYLPSGAPKFFGKVTAVWRHPKTNETAPVYLPISMLSKIPGVMSEQGNVRSNDLDWLVDHMGKTGKLPKIDGREYTPFITVDHRGMPFVSEGNHRIMAAAKLGWDYLPVEVRYFNGAEDVDGPLHPDRIRAMQPQSFAKADGGDVEAAGMGINVRSDKNAGIRYADEIVDGNKKYETRDSDSLRPYVGKRVAIVRTGEGPAKAIGEVTVGEPVVADQALFHKMRPHHLVPAGSAFDIKPGSQKYLYPMHNPVRFDTEKNVGAGIIARKVMSKATGGIVDDEKSIRRALMIAKADGGSLGGLEFPEDESAFRLRTKLNRQAKVSAGKPDPGLPLNQRMIIRAPKAKKGEQQLPNFVTGPLTFGDWTKRVESILTPAEIEHSAKWYRNIKGNFLNYVNGDEQQANKLMRAWLVAQQNTSPATAFNNVLLQREQILRGMPEHLWKAGGMPNPTAAARSVLQDQPIRSGVGVKISDFVDSAEGKNVRSWHGNKEEGGSPFVIDVHSARDTGLVDPALLNHLKNLGYNEDDISKAQIDFDASPSDAQYENRAQWGRDLTNFLNKKGWMGIKNWRPEEIQAVGWMGMTKLTRNAEEDSASGLGRNLRRISYELSPGEGSPWAEKYGHAFEGLPDEERYNITQKMATRAAEIAHQYAGTLPVSTVHGTGAWMQYQNPAAVEQTLSTQQGADIAANVIGHLLHQTEVWHNRVKPVTSSPKGFAVDFVEKNSKNLTDRSALRDFWQKIMDADKSELLQGFQPITLPNGQVGVRALVDKGGTGTRDKLMKTLQEGGELDTMLKSLPFDVESQLSEAEITKARNDWKEHENGQSYVQRISDLVGSDPSTSLRAHGSQLEKELQGHLDEAYARQGGSWRQNTPGAPAQAQVTPTTPQNFSGGGSIDHALRIAANVRGYGRFS